MVVLYAVGLTVACAELDRPALDALAPTGEGFAAQLARGYKAKALIAEQTGDGRAAARLSAKALAAGQGLVDPPDTVSDRPVVYVRAERSDDFPVDHHRRMPGENRPPHPWTEFEDDGVRVPTAELAALAEARRRLIEALARGARHRSTAEAATAQVTFDCWAGLAGEPAGAACRTEALAGLTRLDVAVAGKPYHIETADGGTLRPCPKNDRLTRHYTLIREPVLTADLAETLDRARLESAAGLACSETPLR